MSNILSPLSYARQQEPSSSHETNAANYKAAAVHYKDTTEKTGQLAAKKIEENKQLKTDNTSSIVGAVFTGIGTVASAVVTIVKTLKK